MSIEEIKALFPLKGRVTQEIIDNANLSDLTRCIGALTFKQALGKPLPVYWGDEGGIITERPKMFGEIVARIGTVGNVQMMNVKEPMDVTFILREETASF